MNRRPQTKTAKNGPSIGLFGGSFNPAHAGHIHLAEIAKRNLRLDQIWWLVSPQNPLKPKQPSYESRVASVHNLGLPRGMKVAHLERDFGTQYTIDLIHRAQTHYPSHRFVFLMGADNFAQLPKWRAWQDIINAIPIGIIARPTNTGEPHFRARLGQAARMFGYARVPERASHIMAGRATPCWTYITAPLNGQSSSAIRRAKA